MASTNAILVQRDKLSQRHYVTKADPDNAYWFNFYIAKLDDYRKATGDDFCLIIVGNESVETDFFAIPFREVAHIFAEKYLAVGKDRRRRWIGTIQDNKLKITNYPSVFDIGEFFSNPHFLIEPGSKPPADDVLNDYAIENRRMEINARLKQSVFRRRVLANFGGRCCLSGLNEADLLIASHIIPWFSRVDSRLDPANGLCLAAWYDALFDRGMMTFSDDLEVVVPNDVSRFSRPLRDILRSVHGLKAIKPKKFPIKSGYLRYHREKIFEKNIRNLR